MFEFGILEAFIFFCGVCYLFNKNRTDDMVDVISNRLQDVYGAMRMPAMPGSAATGASSAAASAASGTAAVTDERMSANVLRRFGDEHRRRNAYNKEMEKQDLDSKLYELKEIPPPTLQLPSKPVPGLSCRHCAPSNSEVQLDPIERMRDVKDILRITQHAGWRPNSTIFDWGGWCPFLAQVVRLKRMPFPQVSDAVLRDDRLKTAIEQAAKDSLTERQQQLADAANSSNSNGGHQYATTATGNNTSHSTIGDNASAGFDAIAYLDAQRRYHEQRAKRVLLDMRSTISDVMLRLTSWVLYKLLPCFLSGVVAHPAQVDMLKAASAKAPGAPLIYLPLHRSHLDYILVSFILLNNDIRSPIVAAGNNLRIPLFGGLLRYLGAFFIKRKIDPVAGKKDVVYRAVLHTYVQHALAAGHNVEFFVEGGRTRTGKPCMPKSGVLSVIVDAYLDGTITDALLVPVSVNYERLVDGNFVREQLGQKKQPETFRSAISAIWHILHSRYGLMRIDFNEPFSIRELVKSFDRLSGQPTRTVAEIRAAEAAANGGCGGFLQQQPQQQTQANAAKRLQHNPSTSSLYGTDLVHEEQRSLVDNIARHVVYDCASATSVMTTNAVAFLLLTRFRDGATLAVLAEALDALRAQLEGRKDIGFTGESVNVVKYAVEVLGDQLIAVEKRAGQLFYKPIATHESHIELAYYANSLVPHFALDSVVVTAMAALKREAERVQGREFFNTSRAALFAKCMEHCDMLRYEFILSKPCQEIEHLLDETLNRLKDQQLISQPEPIYSEMEQRGRRLAMRLADEMDYDDDESDYDDHMPRPARFDGPPISLPTDGHCERLVLAAVLAPIGHTYVTVAETLETLIGTAVAESEFVRDCVQRQQAKVDANQCRYAESISTDTVRNCIKLLDKWLVLEVHSTPKGRQLSLRRHFDSATGVRTTVARLQDIVVP